MLTEKDVTIIIPHLGKTKEQKFSLNHCLMSLSESAPNIKVIIAKNGGTEPLEGMASKYPILYFRNQGQCNATNQAVKITRTPFIMVSNDDMVYPLHWFERLVKNIQVEVGKPVCISPKLIEPRPGAPTFEVYFCGGAGGDFDKEKFINFTQKYYLEKTDRETRTGFNLPFLISRGLWDLIGGYDINYDPWSSNSDSDLEYKIKLAGVQPMQNTNSIVYHFSQTSGTFDPKNQEYWNKNFAYFQDKWGFPRTDNGIWEANFEIPKEALKYHPDWEGKYGSF